MWIFNQDGFYSVVQDRNNPEQLMIKARNRDHLEAVTSWLTDRGLSEVIGISENPSFDYLVRMTVRKEDWAEYVQNRIINIDYDSVKGHLADKHDAALHLAMLRIWGEMNSYQQEITHQSA